ncbi:hypothetical protein BKA60DRAFT_659394 [Fusarium oxysporum]|nr:hypothetical protein BKA60DRAFT_659394 [Fusarium oxysporum]
MDLTRSSQVVATVPGKGDQILQNAIDSFRTVLTPEQLAEFNSIQSVPDTDAVLIFTAELDLRRRSQKGKSIASRLFPVLQAVHNFTAVIDTFISSNPTIAALVWGSVKLTMQIMLNAASYYEAFAELFMNLGTICPRFEQYQALFPNSERLQTALCNFNASIIRCCQHVIDMPKSGSGWTSPLNPLNASFWQSFQQAFESNLQELRDYSKNVKEEIRLAQAQSEYRNRELQRIEQDQAEKSRLSLGRFMSRTRDDFDTMRQSQVLGNQQLEKEKNQKLLDSLSSHDYLKPLKQARQKRYPQSADWIFDTGEFKRWAEGTAARFLWCSGKMGSGKTILAASVIDYLLTKPSQAGSRVTFFFSRFDEPESLTAETTLRAIAKQLIYPRDISDYIKQALEKVQNANGEVLSQVSELFIHLLSKGSRTTWIILDGLDEFPRDERRKLIDVLGSILLVPEVKIANPGLERLSMNCPLGKSGMEELVNQAVQNCLDAEELLVSDKELIAEIKNTLTQNANGMHVVLWVALVLRDICTQPNNEMVRKAIAVGNLPRSLTDVFNRALERIISTGGERVTQALLPWIVAAKQPLTRPQLQECCFISILQKHSMKDRYINGIQRLDAWFQGLVEIDHETKTVHLVHASVQQFFQTVPDKPNLAKFHVQAKEADLHLGEICITYLNFNDFKTTLSRRRPPLPPMAPDEICAQALSCEWSWAKLLILSRGISSGRRRAADIDGVVASYARASDATVQETIINDHPFILYASAYWLLHTANFNEEQCRTWNQWRNMLIHGHELAASPVSEERHQGIDHALLVWASSTGHSSLFHVVATSRELVDQFYSSMFDHVLERNDTTLLSKMLSAGTWVSVPNSLCYRAAREGLLGIVQMLVKGGVDINAGMPDSHGVPFNLPLMASIETGQIGIMEYLLQNGANPNSRTTSYRNALEPAAELGGFEGIQACQMLINAGAKPESGEQEPTARSTLGYNALQRACRRGEFEITRLLLDAGADANGTPKAAKADFPLQLSIRSENIPIIDILISHGADVNVQTSDGDAITPLLKACSLESPRLVIVQLLIRAGAKVRDSKDKGDRLLQEAIRSGNCNLVRLLIREGANVDGDGTLGIERDATPLTLAAHNGLLEIMHILLVAGARVVDANTLAAKLPATCRDGKHYKEVLRKLKSAEEKNKERLLLSDRRGWSRNS